MKEKILASQAFWLISTSVFTTYALYLPSRIVQLSGPDFWLAEILALVLCLPLILLVVLAGMRYPEHSFVEIVEAALGKPLGVFLNLLFFFSYLLLAATVVRGFVDILIVAILPRTPPVVFIATTLAVSVYLVNNGIRVLGRLAGLAGPMVFALMGVTVFLALREADFSNLLPVLAHGWKPVLTAIPPILTYLAEFGTIAFVMHHLNLPSSAFKISLGCLLFLGLTSIGLTIAVVSVLSVEYSAALTAPFLSLARGIVLGKFLNRIEALVLTIWILGGFVKLAFIHYLSASTLAQTLRLKRHQVVSLPLALLTGTLSLKLFPSIFEVIDFLSCVLCWYHPLIFFGLPILVWTASVIRCQGVSSRDSLKQACTEIKLSLFLFASTVKQAYYSVVTPSTPYQN